MLSLFNRVLFVFSSDIIHVPKTLFDLIDIIPEFCKPWVVHALLSSEASLPHFLDL